MKLRHVLAGAALCAFANIATSAFADMPKEMSWTAYDTGSSGFNIAVAIGQQFKQAHSSEVRILPSGNDTGRLSPVKANRAIISQMGIGTYFAQEGMFEFGTKSWGPQPARLIMAAAACNGLSLAVAKDTGVKEVKDIKGKRVGIVVGSPALTQGVLALISFGGLTEKDVTLVQFSSNNAMWKGIINNEADVALSSTISGQAKEADSSPRGIIWPPMPASDKDGWERIHKRAPYFIVQKATCGAGGLSPEHPITMASYAYPIFMTFADRPAETIYAITKTMIDTYDGYKAGAPGADGMALDLQNFTWVVPYHDGAIRAFKEKGVWSDAAQKHNDGLIARQKVMIDAWNAYRGAAPSDDKAFAEGWLKARAGALRKAGMDVIFE
jgi:TRAP transporter TAXI family solute receptor